ncbi:hypothetical protein P4631_00400 [Halalkalibacterium halodurans]|uniref:hypothetical protein n=1 Tax=Halalkalibacterium halodurans TaxID=86665 RepID=UPI002E206305|nr:hypothetical protein [Halalkalibacterium halodurans]MED4170909.1 hypothetical protein [Halalkalibacterium halodurans]
MKKDIQHTKDLFRQLLELLKKENEDEFAYMINQLELGLRFIDEYENISSVERNINQLYCELRQVYININKPRVGLSDFFLWKDDDGERVKANETLDAIKNDLRQLFRDH